MTELPETTRTEPDADGIFTENSWKYNEKKQLVKIIRRYKRETTIVRTPKCVLERRNFVKFGDAVLTQTGITIRSKDPVYMELVNQGYTDTPSPKFNNPETEIWVPKSRKGNKNPTTREKKTIMKSGYIPPHQRDGYENKDIESYGIRISNIETDYIEDDLWDLLKKSLHLNPIRVKLVVDFKTKNSKGYAFTDFRNKSDYETALEKINGFYLGYSVLLAEKVKPRVG